MIIIDASAAFIALTNRGPQGDAARAALAADASWAAPGVLHAEVLPLLFVLGRTSPADADVAVRTFALWNVLAVDSGPHTARVWELRHNVSSRDGLYVAAAEFLGCPLLTADKALASANGPRCEFRLLP